MIHIQLSFSTADNHQISQLSELKLKLNVVDSLTSLARSSTPSVRTSARLADAVDVTAYVTVRTVTNECAVRAECSGRAFCNVSQHPSDV